MIDTLRRFIVTVRIALAQVLAPKDTAILVPTHTARGIILSTREMKRHLGTYGTRLSRTKGRKHAVVHLRALGQHGATLESILEDS